MGYQNKNNLTLLKLDPDPITSNIVWIHSRAYLDPDLDPEE